MPVWQKMMLWLGLGPDEVYDEYDEPASMQRPLSSSEFEQARDRNSHNLKPQAVPLTQTPDFSEISGTVRPLRAAASAKPHTVAPVKFEDCKEMADRFLGGQPVIVNVQGVDHEVARRIIDFASGLCYGNEGKLERVNSQVYLLTPSDVEISVKEKLRIRDDDSNDQI